MTISSYIIDNIAIRPVNVISEAVSIRTEMKKMPEEYLWIHANEIEDIFPLQDIFGLHPLTVEAILHHNQPSKIEEYSRYIFAIIDGIADNQEKKMDETNNNKNDEKILSMMVLEDDLYMYLENRWIITLNVYNQHFEENVKKNIKAIIQQTKRNMPNSTPFSMDNDIIDNNKKNILKKNELIFRLALEEMILSYFPIIDNISKDIEQTEEDILAEDSGISKSDKFQLSKILLLRKKISFIERTLGMMSRAVQDFVHRNKISSNEYPSVSGTLSIKSDKQSITTKSPSTLLNPDSISQIRSLNDRIIYLRNDVENMHQRLISLRETYNSSLSANLNETIRTLTVIATIVLPLTLITGIYGMNFEFMPELTSKYGYYYALGLIAALGGGMIMYFKRKRWI